MAGFSFSFYGEFLIGFVNNFLMVVRRKEGRQAGVESYAFNANNKRWMTLIKFS